MRLRLLLFAALLASLGFAPAPLPKPVRRPAVTDRDRLQGRWEAVAVWYAGGQMTRGLRLTVEGDRWVFVEGDADVTQFEVRLNPRAQPRTIDLVAADDDTRRMAATASETKPCREDRESFELFAAFFESPLSTPCPAGFVTLWAC